MIIRKHHKSDRRSPSRHGQAGFTFFEMLISVGILAIISTVASVSWFGYQQQAAVDAGMRDTLNRLREAQGNAIARRDGTDDGTPDTWGVRIMNESMDESWARMYAGSDFATGTLHSRTTFSPRVDLQLPAEGEWIDVRFDLRTGRATFTGSGMLPACPAAMMLDCVEAVLYNLSEPARSRGIRVWSQGGVEAL